MGCRGCVCDRIPAELFQILKDDVVKLLCSMCQQIETTQQWPEDRRRSVFIPIPKKSKAKECSTTIQLCSFHMLASLCSKSFKLVFSSGRTNNFQMHKLGLEKAEEHPLDHRKSNGIPEKNIYFCFIDYQNALCGWQQTKGNSKRDENIRPPYLSLEKPICKSRSNT